VTSPPALHRTQLLSNQPRAGAAPGRSDVFISYSRKDEAFVRAVHQSLATAGRDAWVDWEDIPPSAEWLNEIERAIEAADVVVFVVSPDSVQSKTCRRECEHAARWNKRIVPILFRPVLTGEMPEAVSRVNWLRFDGSSVDTCVAALLRTIDTDLDWLRAHSRLLVRAREWDANGKDAGYLLGGIDLDQAERWLVRAAALDPAPTPLHMSFVAASRQESTRRQRNQLRGFYVVALVYAGMQVFVSYFVAFDHISEAGLVALSPLWVIGLVFGIFGLTAGKTSLKRSVIAALIAGAALYLFFAGLWRSL
jgi:hypothetical protein